MTSTFLVSVDHGDDTDLVGIAIDLQDALLNSPFEILSVTPWTHPTLGQTAPTQTAEPLQ